MDRGKGHTDQVVSSITQNDLPIELLQFCLYRDSKFESRCRQQIEEKMKRSSWQHPYSESSNNSALPLRHLRRLHQYPGLDRLSKRYTSHHFVSSLTRNATNAFCSLSASLVRRSCQNLNRLEKRGSLFGHTHSKGAMTLSFPLLVFGKRHSC